MAQGGVLIAIIGRCGMIDLQYDDVSVSELLRVEIVDIYINRDSDAHFNGIHLAPGEEYVIPFKGTKLRLRGK